MLGPPSERDCVEDPRKLSGQQLGLHRRLSKHGNPLPNDVLRLVCCTHTTAPPLRKICALGFSIEQQLRSSVSSFLGKSRFALLVCELQGSELNNNRPHSSEPKISTITDKDSSMKMKQLFAVCGMAVALICGATAVSAQDNNGGGGGGGQGGPGGGGGFGGRGGGGGMDPAQFQQRMMDRMRDQLGFTNDTDWNAVQPLVQKVSDAQRDLRAGQMQGMRMLFRRPGQNNDDNQRRQRFGGFMGQPSPEYTALQDAVDNNAPEGQIKDLLTRYNASQKAKEDKLKAAQDNLRAVLSVKQEASATLIGLLN
jgi:hypothetical protein